MEKKEIMMAVKMKDTIGSASSFPSYSYSFPSEFDFSEEKSSEGFMELLGVQNYSPLLDLPVASARMDPPAETGKEYSEEVLNKHQQPATPNSSSITTASSTEAAVNDEQNKTVDQANQPQKQLKAKKRNYQKRQREARFAFMTKSEVDQLEDGYRWRKYGQKAVKNSPFPRSYYRCTSASCNVKKRVERSLTDPSIVMTTYEGQHTHPSPVMARSAHAAASPIPQGIISAECTTNLNYMSQYYQHHQQVLVNTLMSSSGCYPSKNIATDFPQERPLCINPTRARSVLLRDHGLLQDVIPSHMLKENQ